jgi:hypothetical protein
MVKARRVELRRSYSFLCSSAPSQIWHVPLTANIVKKCGKDDSRSTALRRDIGCVRGGGMIFKLVFSGCVLIGCLGVAADALLADGVK